MNHSNAALKAVAEMVRMMQAQFEAMNKQQRKQKASTDDFKFWKTQPVPRLDEEPTDSTVGPIEKDKAADEIKTDPSQLPAGYEWFTVDIENEQECQDVYELLSLNYVEDDDALFRFDYSADFLRWYPC